MPAASRAGRPLVLLGALHDERDREDVLAFCRSLGAPVLAESSSELRPRLGDLLLLAGEEAAARGFEDGLFDSVVRVGDIPSFRLWRDLELGWRVPVFSASRAPWPGLTHALHVQVPAGAPLVDALPSFAPFPAARREALLAFDRARLAVAHQLIARFPLSEPALVRAVSSAIPSGSFVYLGNSLPIREWNQFAVTEDRGFIFGANRGANGIDGQLSTFLGQAMASRENWALVGDLTALYDLQAPWALQHAAGRVRVVILNNGGGRIFERMFANARFQNRHGLTFEAFADMWGLEHRCDLPGGEWDATAGIVELRPDERQTRDFWNALRETPSS